MNGNSANTSDLLGRLSSDEAKRAQEALYSIVPHKLRENLNAFRKFMPRICERFEHYQPTDRYILTCLENGEPDLLDTASGTLVYGGNSFARSRALADSLDDMSKGMIKAEFNDTLNADNKFYQYEYFQNQMILEDMRRICSGPSDVRHLESVPLVFMFGLGLGFQLGYIYEKMTPVSLYVVEPSPDLFYWSLCCFDYSPLLEYAAGRGISIYLNLSSEHQEFFSDLREFFILNVGLMLPFKLLISYRDRTIDRFKEIWERNFPTMSLANGFIDDYLFGFNHSCSSLLAGIPLMRKTVLSGSLAAVPAVVVGNGPSLDDDIELLRKYQDRCVIIACGTAYSALCRCGICADIYVAVERIPPVYDSLVAITEHREFFDRTVCFALDVVQTRVLQLFRHSIIVPKDAEFTMLLLSSCCTDVFSGVRILEWTNPLVANFGLELTAAMGFKTIYLLGTDNGSASDQGHSQHSFYFDENHELQDQYKNLPTDIMHETMAGNFVPEVRTNALFKSSISQMEMCIAKYRKQTRFFNCSNGARISGADPRRFAEIGLFHFAKADKKDLRNRIYRQFSLKFPDVGRLKQLVRADRLDGFFASLLAEWDTRPAGRAEFVLRQECQLNALKNMILQGFVPGLCVLRSYETFLLYVNHVLYYFEDENRAVELAHSLLVRHLRGLEAASKYLISHVDSFDFGPHRELVDHAVSLAREAMGMN